MLSFATVPPRMPAEPIRDYLIYAHWCTTGRDHRTVATSLGLTADHVHRLAHVWSWHHRLATHPNDNTSTTNGADGRTTPAGNDYCTPDFPIIPAQRHQPNAHSMSQWSATNTSHDTPQTRGRAHLLWLLDHWPLDYLADLCSLRPSTRAGYLADVCRYLTWCEHDALDPLVATRADIARYRDDVLRGVSSAMPSTRPAAPATVARRIAVVRHLYGWLTRVGLTPACPARLLPMPVVDASSAALRRPWLTTSERQQVIATVDAAYADGMLRARDRAIIYLLAYAAPRVSEVSGLTVAALRDDRTLTWSGKGGRPRTIRLTEGVAGAIEDYLAERRRDLTSGYRLAGSAPMFATSTGRAIQPRQIAKLVARVCLWAAIPHRSPHAWRHGLITAARQAGMTREEVQAYIGHARGDTTARYEHLAPGRALDAGARLWELDHDAARSV